MSDRLTVWPTLRDAKYAGAISFEWSHSSVIAFDSAGIPWAMILTQSEDWHSMWRQDMEWELATGLGVVRPQGWQ